MPDLREFFSTICCPFKHSSFKSAATKASKSLPAARQQNRVGSHFSGLVMKLNKHEQAEPNIAGLTSHVQQTEMKLILAGTWPPLKPLPVFKYGTDEYRAEIHFDRTRGEWVCRKTSLLSNKVQELRGGLTEMTMALPHDQADVFTEAVAAEPQEQELENEANRRLQAILEWQENYGKGALYSELQDYLSESQQDEIYDSIRMTLTARQLQFNPKNVEFVFDALLNAGGRLATLIEMAQRKKVDREAEVHPRAETATLEAESQAPTETIHPTRDRRLQMRTTPVSVTPVMFGDTNYGIVLNISETGMAVAVADLLVGGDYPLHVLIQLPMSRQGIEISAQIVWLAESKKGAGIRFVHLTAEAGNQISNWIESEKPAPDFEKLPKLLRRDKLPMEISPGKSRRISSNPSVRDEDVAARYQEMFPSDGTHAKRTTTVDEIKLQQGPFRIPASCHADAGHSVVGSSAGISTGEFSESLEAGFPSERARHFVREPIKTSNPELGENLTPEPVDGFIPPTLENFPTEPLGSVSPVAREILVAVFVFLFAVIGFTVGLTVGRGPLGRTLRDTQKSVLVVDDTSPVLPNRPGEATSSTYIPPAADTLDTPAVIPQELRPESPSAQSLNARPADSVTRLRPTGPSSAVTSRFHIDSDQSWGANKLDDKPPSEEKSKEGTRDAEPSVKVPSTDSNSSPTIESKRTAIPEVSPERNGSTGLIARNAPPPARAERAHSTVAVGPIPAGRRNRALLTTKPATAAAPKSPPHIASLKHAYPAVAAGPVRSGPRNVALLTAKPVTGTARNPSLPTASPKHPHLAVVVGPRDTAPGSPAPRRVTPATDTALQASPPSSILVTAPAKVSKSLRLSFPQKPIAASFSFAISSQLSIFVSPEPGPGAHQPARLQAGELVFYVWPRYPRLGDRYGSTETVKVRAIIGQLGQVLDVKFVSGSTSLLPATMTAVRQWRYHPTLLNDKPVQVQQDVTIEFRAPKYLSHVHTQRSHN
jgi:hypothetical protein